MRHDDNVVHRDAFRMLTGKRLGGGMSREVYECELFPDCVVKVEDSAGFFQNVIEWETWSRVRGTAYERWFAPCRWISPNGSILIMARTTELREHELPKRMPVFLTDFKRQNYGRLGRQVVCHDYGTNLMFERGMTKRTRSASWW